MAYEFNLKCTMKVRCDVSGCGDYATFERSTRETSDVASAMKEELLPTGWTRVTRGGHPELRCRRHSAVDGVSEDDLNYLRALVSSIDAKVTTRAAAAVSPSAILDCLIGELHRCRDLAAEADDRTARMLASVMGYSSEVMRYSSEVDALKARVREACDLSDVPKIARDADWEKRREELRGGVVRPPRIVADQDEGVRRHVDVGDSADHLTWIALPSIIDSDLIWHATRWALDLDGARVVRPEFVATLCHPGISVKTRSISKTTNGGSWLVQADMSWTTPSMLMVDSHKHVCQDCRRMSTPGSCRP